MNYNLIYKLGYMFTEIQVKAFDCKCDNCHHEWRSVRETPPTHCPNKGCSNPTRWNMGGTKQKYERRSAKVEEKETKAGFIIPVPISETEFEEREIVLIDET